MILTRNGKYDVFIHLDVKNNSKINKRIMKELVCVGAFDSLHEAKLKLFHVKAGLLGKPKNHPNLAPSDVIDTIRELFILNSKVNFSTGINLTEWIISDHMNNKNMDKDVRDRIIKNFETNLNMVLKVPEFMEC